MNELLGSFPSTTHGMTLRQPPRNPLGMVVVRDEARWGRRKMVSLQVRMWPHSFGPPRPVKRIFRDGVQRCMHGVKARTPHPPCPRPSHGATRLHAHRSRQNRATKKPATHLSTSHSTPMPPSPLRRPSTARLAVFSFPHLSLQLCPRGRRGAQSTLTPLLNPTRLVPTHARACHLCERGGFHECLTG
jgi:hypothetical protein